MQFKFLFIDRDGTLIDEPKTDFQVDSLAKLKFEKNVIPALLKLIQAGYKLVMVTNQDGLGTEAFPQEDFDAPHNMMLEIFKSQGIEFDEVLICPHFSHEECDCRKPKIKLLQRYIDQDLINLKASYVIGDRQTDLQLAESLNVKGLLYSPDDLNWDLIAEKILNFDKTLVDFSPRIAKVERKTKETDISVEVFLDETGHNNIHTGLGFYDHMLDQIATHGGFRMNILTKGDLHIDDHHTIEDTALALGEAIKNALGNKLGIARFGFNLPMDECDAHCSLDLSGRPYLVFDAEFSRDKVGDFSTEMTKHFFHSISYSMAATLHLSTKGDNDHHKIESLFKAFGRTLRQAVKIESKTLPSSKGVL